MAGAFSSLHGGQQLLLANLPTTTFYIQRYNKEVFSLDLCLSNVNTICKYKQNVNTIYSIIVQGFYITVSECKLLSILKPLNINKFERECKLSILHTLVRPYCGLLGLIWH